MSGKVYDVGKLIYDGVVAEMDDRLLSHLQIVIINKMRRHEGFALSWINDAAAGGGRSTIWVQASIPIHFRFDNSQPPQIDRDWLELLTASALSPTGLFIKDGDGKPVEIIYTDHLE